MKLNPCLHVYDDAPPERRSGSRRYDKATIDHLRNRLPEYLAAIGIVLSRKGTRIVGSCPAHDDRDPSFAVFGQSFATCGCYPCGFKGDVFAVSVWLGRASSFPEALEDVAGSLGIILPDQPFGAAVGLPVQQKKPAKAPAAVYVPSEADQKKIHSARLAFSDAFWGEDEIVERITKQLGLKRETLRLAAWGSCGLGLADGWLCYAYPCGLKWRNPNPSAKPRFRWIVGKATAPWRMEWVGTATRTIFLTEGESDTMALIEAGIEADGQAVSVASPGTSFARSWAPLFDGKRVVLCFDDDPPGREATANVAAILKGHAAEVLKWKGSDRHG